MGLIQFSGVKQMEGSYKPGSGGVASGQLNHWQWEVEPTALTTDNTRFAHLKDSGKLFLSSIFL